MTSLPASLLAALAAPMTHRVVTVYEDGETRGHNTRSIVAAENFATGERRKIGRDLIDRSTGATVRVIAVTVLPLDRDWLAGTYAKEVGYDPFRDDPENASCEAVADMLAAGSALAGMIE